MKGVALVDLSLYDLYQDMKVRNILFSYSGPIAQSSIEGVGDTLRRNLEFEEAKKTAVYSVFSIFIEQVQNVLNYSAERVNKDEEDENELRVGIVVIGREENDDYYIYCGNRVYNSDIGKIKAHIDSVKNCSKQELKALYKERRRMEPESGSKGAGLGLIEMARKAGKPIDYSFAPITEEFSFFSIKVVVRR